MLVIVSKDAFEDQWEMNNPDREIIDLTAHWGKGTLHHCCTCQRDFNVMNSLDPKLKKQVYKRYSKLEAYQQGGITFFKITMDTVFKMSIMAEESLMSFIKDFGKKPRYQVRTCASFPDGSMELLSG